MKKDQNDLYNDEIDKLLFDYLEGDLSLEATTALEERFTYDANLKEELKSWTESYIEQDFYPTELLEEKISHNTFKNRKVYTESYILIVAVLTSCLSFIHFTIEKEQKQLLPQMQSKNIVKVEEKEAVVTDQPVNNTFNPDPVGEKSIVVDEIKKEEIFNQVKEKRITYSKIEPLPLSDFSLDGVSIKEDIKRLPVKPKKPEKAKKEYSSKISKKEQRAIERSKEKALQKRIEEKYLRGRKAYVVPLNPNF